MNRLKKILLSFVLPIFCLLISVSNADFSSVPLAKTSNTWQQTSNTIAPLLNTSYTNSSAYTIIRDYLEDDYGVEQYNSLIETLKSNGYDIYFGIGSGYRRCVLFVESGASVGRCPTYEDDSSVYFTDITKPAFLFMDSSSLFYFVEPFSNSYYSTTIGNLMNYSTISVKKLYYSNGPCWDGESYIYQAPSSGEDTPSLPSNAEIAQSVQLFYNTIYNQPNIAFDDFIVLYDVSTGLYSYIGHTRGNAIGQVIVEPNGYYNGYKFDKQWWQFFHDEQNDSWDWENLSKYNNYYLYSSQGTIDTLEFVGKDKIDNLFTSGPFSTSNTFIVYSTNDYPVKYITFSDESPDPVVDEGTIKGDQYTYDENLDITDNQYNPLDNFVSIDYPSTLVSRADFEGFMNIFNENKEYIVLPGNANWIILANNSLFGHFSSFIVMCTIFIIIERFMRG